jgi:hypothetical protein
MIEPRIDFEKKAATRKTEDESKLKGDFARVCATEEGQAVMRFLLLLTGFQDFLTCVDTHTNELQPLNTIYNEARRNLWLTMRQYIPHENLISIELPYPKPVKEQEEDES